MSLPPGTRATARSSVWTACISTRDPDALNVTRKSGDPVFAPSWPLLHTVLTIRRAGRVQTDDEWRTYATSYLREMGQSYDAHRGHWEAVLTRPRVVLTCYCADASRCHRRLLARVLERLGARDMGELPGTRPDGEAAARQLFDLAMSLDEDSDLDEGGATGNRVPPVVLVKEVRGDTVLNEAPEPRHPLETDLAGGK